MASAKSSVKTTSGIIAPLAAAAMGLAGSSDGSHAASPVACWPAARSPAASTAPGGNAGRVEASGGSKRNAATASGMAKTAMPAINSTNTAIVRAPRRPIARRSAAEATPVTSSETTSGITVIRMALTHSVPTGATASAARSQNGSPLQAMAAPAASPAASAMRTQMLLRMATS